MDMFFNCPLCNHNKCSKDTDNKTNSTHYNCEMCGGYVIQSGYYEKVNLDKLTAFLYYNHEARNSEHPNKAKIYVLGSDELLTEYKERYPNSNLLTSEMVENWYPKTFSDKVDLFLLNLYKKTKYMGEVIHIDHIEQGIAFFFDNHNEEISEERDYHINFFNSYLRKQEFLSNEGAFEEFCLAPKGYQRVDELQKYKSSNPNVFVSMAFNDNTKSTREAIRNGIIDAGYSPEFIDEIIHNHQIVPEMFRLIRECRFLILDISEPNYGAYYEAGYAMGLGKEVIICCSKESFSKEYITDEEKRYQKYLKPHFDIAQKQILVWNDEKDLTHKLSEWIKAIIG